MFRFSIIRKSNIKNIKGNFIFLYLFFLLSLLLINACTMLPTPSNNWPGRGSIQIYSEPSAASIYLDGADTGYVSPKILSNLYPGSYLVTLKLEGYLNSSNFVQVYPNQTTPLSVILTPNPYLTTYPDTKLLKIEVEPKTLIISIGESAFIDAITAFYSDNSTKIISANQCYIYSTKPNVATVSPNGQIIAFSEGQTNIWVEYTELNITTRDSILVSVYSSSQEPGNLLSISVLPKNMLLNIGESKAISSITAYYDNEVERIISPYLCNFSANNSFITVNNAGEITGISEGDSIVTVSYTEGSITKTDTLSVSVSNIIVKKSNYRALAIGIGDYIYYGPDGDLLAPPYDVNKMTEIYANCRFGSQNTTFTRIDTLINQQATKNNIFNKIANTFSGANENDVSYFYFSGHGALLNNISYLCPTDFNGSIATAISINELESALSSIPGAKVVFLDSCHSGGFIGKSALETNEEFKSNYLSFFNNSIIDIFASKSLSKGLLTTNDYQVLTSSHWYELSYEIHPTTGEPFGVFTQALYEGCSLTNNTPADVNNNNKITLQEAYQFIAQWVAAMRINQNVQVYPTNSLFTIFEY